MARKKKTATKKVGKVAKVARRGTAAKAKTTTAASKSRRTTAKGKVARRARRSRDSIIAILEEAKSRGSNAEVIRKHKLSPTTFYSWKRKFVVGRRKRSK